MAVGGIIVAAPALEGMVMRHWRNRNLWWKTDMLWRGGEPSPLLLFSITVLTQIVLGINPDLTTDKSASNYVNYGMV